MTPPVPSSPQRGLADRMFLDGPANRLSTCEPHNLLWYSHILTRIHYIRRIKPDLFLLSRLWPRVPLAECHQRQTIHPEPEGDRQPAQIDAALKTLGMLGPQMCRDCGSVAHICMKELEGFFLYIEFAPLSPSSGHEQCRPPRKLQKHGHQWCSELVQESNVLHTTLQNLCCQKSP